MKANRLNDREIDIVMCVIDHGFTNGGQEEHLCVNYLVICWSCKKVRQIFAHYDFSALQHCEHHLRQQHPEGQEPTSTYKLLELFQQSSRANNCSLRPPSSPRALRAQGRPWADK